MSKIKSFTIWSCTIYSFIGSCTIWLWFCLGFEPRGRAVFKYFMLLLYFSLFLFDHNDIHKKARHEISLMSGKIKICVRRLEDYHALRHNTVNINNLAFDFIYNRHLLAERDGSHYFSILDR